MRNYQTSMRNYPVELLLKKNTTRMSEKDTLNNCEYYFSFSWKWRFSKDPGMVMASQPTPLTYPPVEIRP